MTRLEEIRSVVARDAIGAALDTARASYAEISAARNAINNLESSGVYAEGYIEEQRSQRAEAVARKVEGILAGARGKIDSAGRVIEGELDRASAVDPGRVAAAQGQISMFLGDLSESPEELLGVYERVFDVPEDRRAVEELAHRALKVLPETPSRDMFEEKWNLLQEQLEDRLPEKAREFKRDLAELERAREYLGAVAQATTAAIRGLTEPRQGFNLTAFAKANGFEEEKLGESIIEGALSRTPLAGTR